MTTRELNRDINRLYNSIQKDRDRKDNSFFDKEKEYKDEFKRLYYADRHFKYMSRKSILQLMEINRGCQFIPFYLFGIYTEI